MKTNPNDTINVVLFEGNREESGLTKREYFAALILQGMSQQLLSENNETAAKQMHNRAVDACLQADLFIDELNNSKETK